MLALELAGFGAGLSGFINRSTGREKLQGFLPFEAGRRTARTDEASVELGEFAVSVETVRATKLKIAIGGSRVRGIWGASGRNRRRRSRAVALRKV